MKSKKDIALRYDASAEIYDQRYKDIQAQKYREIFSRLEINGQESILDIGCGTGMLLGLLNNHKEKSTKLVGIDISLEMVKIANKKHPEIDFLVADSDSLPLRENTFSKIISVTVLQNLPEPKYTINEIFRVSKADCKIAISILRKTWTLEELEKIILAGKLQIHDKWMAEIEDIGVLCSKSR
ncbi:MAG: class I SAM-dependent methyltransferase [Candidatus Thorarchaeota archaeon]